MSLAARIHAGREAKRARMAQKPTHAVVRNRAYDVATHYAALSRSGTSMADQQDVDVLTVGPLAQLERLRTGCLDANGFVELSEACACAAEIADQIARHAAGQETVAQMEIVLPELLKAAPILLALADRHTTTGRWITKGGELATLQSILAPGGYYEQLILVSDRGLLCRALTLAAKSVKAALGQKSA